MNTRTLPWIAAALVVCVHAIGNAHYGYFRDELYFIICGFHPQFGYVDQPPLVPLLSAMTQLAGHSLWLLRMVPALFAGAAVYVTCLLVVEFGGGVFAQALATLAFLFAPVLMSFGMKVSTDEVNLLTWPFLTLVLVRLVKGADARCWLAAGAIAGVTLQSKYSIVFYLIALALAMLLTPQRRVFKTPWFIAGVALIVLIALPNVLWQAHFGFPMIELLRNGQNGKNLVVGPLMYLVQEFIITNLFLVPIWLIGIVWLLRHESFRFLGYAYLILIALMIVTHGKHYYPASVYAVEIAAGSVAIEGWTKRFAPLRATIVAYTLLAGIIFVPLTLPVLPEAAFVSYMDSLTNALHLSKSATATEHHRDSGALPGDWADMHGWPQMASTIARIYDALPPLERAQAVVVASNYGEASAVAFFEPQVPVISGHNQWYLWGTRGYSGNVVIDVNGDCGGHGHLFQHVERAATFTDPWAVGYENNLPIMLCRGIREPLSLIWSGKKEYI